MKASNMLAFCLFLLSTITICTAVDTIRSNQSIGDNETLVSSDGNFALGFFRPGNSKNRYIGIWYTNTANLTVVWVANRENPLTDANAVLKVNQDGLLVLLDFKESVIWSSNSSTSSKNPVAQLLDSGNLVVKDASDDNPDHYLWQSFDHPCSTLLPGMKLGPNMLKGQERSLTSWKSNDDPAKGDFERRIDPNGYPQSIIVQGKTWISRLGPWNGLGFSGHSIFKPNPYIDFEFFISQEEIFYRYWVNSTVPTRLELNPYGLVERFLLINRTGYWKTYVTSHTDQCDDYNFCGENASCNITDTPIFCACLEGFKRQNSPVWSAGCVRKTPLNCGGKDFFIRHPNVKLPDTRTSWYNTSIGLEECKTMCSRNCTCTAYANMDVRDGTGCLLWFGDLFDIRESSTNAQDLYVRATGVPLCDTCKTFCGAYGKCNISNGCECLNGFEPKNPKEWQMADWSNGCVRKTGLDCVGNCDYVTQRNIQLPDTLNASYTENMSLEECNTRCLKDTSCTAYAVRDTKDGGPECFLWFGDLVGIGECKKNGRDLFVRVSPPPPKQVPGIPLCGTCNTSCGAYGKCIIGNGCGCLDGFEPRNPKAWEMKDWSHGCVRKTQLDCEGQCDYLTQQNIQLPDTLNASYIENMSLEECRTTCFNNSSCTAYATRDAEDGGPGCFLWSGDLIGIGDCKTNGRNLYVKVDSPTTPTSSAKKQKGLIIAISVSLTCVLVLAVGLVLYMWERKKLGLITNGNPSDTLKLGPTSDSQKEDLELQCFYFPAIVKATNNFSQENEVGRGGFGPVYKGVLPDGQEIAVKKLSEDSEQGNNEFRNEVMYIARLQHRNLVKLLGYCLQGTEKVLIYEFMKNRSLDVFIFGRTQYRLILDWSKRLNVITGIARGLLYLHQDSRLRIVHRDLKAGNILLDSEMNPKISDFGTARSFGGNETEANTRNVVGSHGYISPEYAMDGLFSVKSDVFSFGVLVLEIVSGKTNRRSENQQQRLNLVGHAWKLFQEGRSNELIDETIESSSNSAEVLRVVHVGLLCVQQCAQDRPNMASVVRMLEGESALPQPQQPGFYTERNLLLEAALEDSSSSKPEGCSINMVTITLVKGR